MRPCSDVQTYIYIRCTSAARMSSRLLVGGVAWRIAYTSIHLYILSPLVLIGSGYQYAGYASWSPRGVCAVDCCCCLLCLLCCVFVALAADNLQTSIPSIRASLFFFSRWRWWREWWCWWWSDDALLSSVWLEQQECRISPPSVTLSGLFCSRHRSPSLFFLLDHTRQYLNIYVSVYPHSPHSTYLRFPLSQATARTFLKYFEVFNTSS